VFWAEAVGLTGGLITGPTDYANTGVRPLLAETAAYNELSTDGLPFFWSGNAPGANGCYFQKSANTWQPEWILGQSGVEHAARIDWGDNLTSQTLTATSVIRIEHALYDDVTGPKTGYVMDGTCTQNPSSPDEIQGTKGLTGLFTPTIYSVTPRLTIQKLTGQGGTPIAGAIAFDGAVADGFGQDGPGFYGAEINVGGKLIYGYVLFMKRVNIGTIPKDGWWRITFALQTGATLPTGSVVSRGVRITALDASDVAKAQLNLDGYTTWMDVEIKSSKGGGGRQNPKGAKP